jgi:hypothetical protein
VANDVEIGARTQLSTETRPWQVEMAAAEDAGDAIGSVTTTLVDLLTGASFPTGLSGAPTFSGTTVSQTVTALVAGHYYRLVWSANMGGAKVSAVSVILQCPY